jgi:8-oxo-dGTP pyrophosphatase MutT (NUDIX family)
MEKKIMTLSFLQEDGRVLLAMKKRGFGEGRWNGYGGKVKEGETIEQAARREILEESGLQVTGLEKRGEVDFTFTDGKLTKVYIFKF